MTIRKKKTPKAPIRFIDLFAGIGGIRMAFEHPGAECVFSSEWNKFAQQTYEKNFGETPVGDIRQVQASDIPDFDVLCAGFPCQPFSIAGVSKKVSLNKPHGFEDETQGTLFYEILRILKERKPAAFFLENVKNLEKHDKGKTFSVIRDSLLDAGYSFSYKVIIEGVEVGDVTKCAAADRRVGSVQPRMVKHVECLESKLEFRFAVDVEVLNETRVGLQRTWPAEFVAACIRNHRRRR